MKRFLRSRLFAWLQRWFDARLEQAAARVLHQELAARVEGVLQEEITRYLHAELERIRREEMHRAERILSWRAWRDRANEITHAPVTPTDKVARLARLLDEVGDEPLFVERESSTAPMARLAQIVPERPPAFPFLLPPPEQSSLKRVIDTNRVPAVRKTGDLARKAKDWERRQAIAEEEQKRRES